MGTDVQPGWYSDPYARHEHRWFDGAVWTAHVSDRGVAALDPLGPSAGFERSAGFQQAGFGQPGFQQPVGFPQPGSHQPGAHPTGLQHQGGFQPTCPEPSRFPAWGWVLVVVAVLAVIGGLIGSVQMFSEDSTARADGAFDEGSGGLDELSGEDFFGEDHRSISELRDDCGSGSLVACDLLYHDTPSGSEDERFAMDCGGRDPGGDHHGDCLLTFEGTEIRGDCASGDMRSCDELCWITPEGSELEAFAMSCGGRSDDEHLGTCEEQFG